MVSVNADEAGIGWIHAEQCRALLTKGGDILYIEGPGLNTAVTGRRRALEQGLAGSHIKIVKTLVADWTEEGAIRVTLAWLQKQSARGYRPALVCAQNDAMAIGMRKVAVQNDRRWAEIPFLGCDGLPGVGQREVLQGSLSATVVKPLTARRAVEQVASILGGEPPHAYLVLSPESFPPVEEINKPKR